MKTVIAPKSPLSSKWGLNIINQRHLTSSVVAAVLLVFVFLLTCLPVQAQSGTLFTPADHFDIPQNNGSINFAVSGNYTHATLENGAWIFTELRLNNSFGAGATLEKMNLTTYNSNITVYSCQKTYGVGQGVRIRYLSEGSGQQVFNFNVNLTRGEWMVSFSRYDYPQEGKGWWTKDDGSVVVNAPSGANVSVSYVTFSNDLGNFDDPNKPFYEKHSVAIVTGVSVAATLAVALSITYVSRNKSQNLAKTKKTFMQQKTPADANTSQIG